MALSWTAPASDGGSSITGYEIWRGTTSGAASLLTTVGLVTSYTDASVSNGTTYYYQVAAVNAVDTGPGSNERSATPTPPPPPTAPGAPNLTSATAGNASVALSWTAPASDGGSSITGYEIWRGTTSGAASLLTTVGLVTSYTDASVSNGTTYYYQVAAVNAVDTGPGSNERSATPTGLVPVTRLGGAASTFTSGNVGSMSFSLPAGTDRLVAMISVYTTSTTVSSMTWKPDPGNPSLNQPLTLVGRQTASANGAVEIWELANPTPGVAGAALSHTLSASAKRVMGVHALAGVGSHGTPVGAGANSNAISVNVPSETGALVLDVIFGSNSTTAHTAGAGQTERWDMNTTGGTNNLRGAGSSEAGAATTTMSWTSGSATHHALLAVSYNPAIPSEPPPPTAPGAPNLTSATAGNASVALSWTAPASDGGSSITGYEIWRGTTSGAASLLTTVGLVTSYTDASVSNGTTYYYQVAAVNAVDTGPGSNERSATPTPPPPPTAPGAPNLTSATAGNASVALSWTAPASDGGSSITGYEIWRGTTSGAASLLTTVGLVTSYTDASVSNGTTYYYQVAAVNAVDTGPGSNERSATPTGLVPVTRLGGAASTFTSGNVGSMSFSLPAGTDRLVAMISVYTTSTTVSSMTWKPDPGNPSLNQPLTLVGRQTASANGAVEIWELANPTPGVAGAALSHTLSASAKRVMGVHALAGVGSHGTPVGAGVNSNAISVNVPSETGALVLDVIFGSNSTTAHTAGAGQTERWDMNTTGGTNNLRGAGSSEAGAATTTMSWTSGSATHHALLAVSYNPH